MANIVRMKDIAQRAGVSTVTVSKALSGQKGVSEGKREEILRLAKEMGYKSQTDRSSRSNVSYNLGILMASRFFDQFNSFYGNLQMLMTNEAAKKECFATMEIISPEMEEKMVMPRLLAKDKVDGYLVLGCLNEAYLDHLDRESDIPYVYVDFAHSSNKRDCVISDSFYGAYQLTNYLFGMGHRDIAYVGTLLTTGSITDRYLGYLKSMMEHGVRVREDWVIPDRDRVTGMMDTGRFFPIPEKMPTAFVCNCDLAASYLERKLKEKGYRCPEDISIAGYDNLQYPAITDVHFTTYEVDTKEMARKAVHNLIHKINREYYRKGTVIVVGHLIQRETVRDLTE